MELTVTPSSGDGPYILSADIFNKSVIDGVRYDLLAYSQSAVGECPIPTSSPNTIVRDSLLYQGFFSRNQSVPVGSCNVYKVDIVDLATSDIVSTQSVSIDNLE